MYIPDEKVEEVRAASDIVDVVSDYVRLKKRGSKFVGLCPFHNEKTPSFNVDPKENLFYCFGCQKGGDTFSFVRDVEHVGFPEAVRMLAERVGVALPEEQEQSEAASEAEQAYYALRFAARFFFRQLTQAEEGKKGLDYLRARGFTPKTIKHFGLGYAPDRWDALLQAADEQQLAPEALARAGLVIERKGGKGYYDRYRGRVIFPIFSHVGKVLGFGGRILDKNSEQPKYINSPETDVYHKSRVLYGLYQGKTAVRRREEVILVEGYTDVVSLHQAGVENAVAASGTSFTKEQVKLISRYAKQIIFLNDSDTAGDNSTVRSIEIVLKEGILTPYVIELPGEEDPDSFVRQHGLEAFEKYLRTYRWSFVQFMLIRARQDGRLSDPQSETKALHEVLRLIALIEDPIAQDAYVYEMSQLLGQPDIMLRSELNRMLSRQSQKAKSASFDTDRQTLHVPDLHEESEVGENNRAGKNEEPARPEERVLVRLMLEHETPMVEFILGSMALEEFTEGAVRQAVNVLLAQYQQGAVRAAALLSGEAGEAVQRFAASTRINQHEPSQNWKKKNIPVPLQDGEPYEAAASAMTLLKLDRVDEAIDALKQKLFAASTDEETREIQEQNIQLQNLKKQVERRAFLDGHVS